MYVLVYYPMLINCISSSFLLHSNHMVLVRASIFPMSSFFFLAFPRFGCYYLVLSVFFLNSLLSLTSYLSTQLSAFLFSSNSLPLPFFIPSLSHLLSTTFISLTSVRSHTHVRAQKECTNIYLVVYSSKLGFSLFLYKH